MRTTRSTVTFRAPFILNPDTGELPAGRYEIETDEEEIGTFGRVAYRRQGVFFHIESHGSTRTLIVEPADLDAALRRDSRVGSQTGGHGAASAPDEART